MRKMKLLATFLLYGVLLAALIVWSPWGKNGEHIEVFHFYYLLLAVIIWGLSYRFFGGRFVRPKWKQAGKLVAFLILSFVLLTLVGHYALIFIVGHQALGGIGHYMICKQHNINFWTCQPEEKYLEVTERWAKDNVARTDKQKNIL